VESAVSDVFAITAVICDPWIDTAIDDGETPSVLAICVVNTAVKSAMSVTLVIGCVRVNAYATVPQLAHARRFRKNAVQSGTHAPFTRVTLLTDKQVDAFTAVGPELNCSPTIAQLIPTAVRLLAVNTSA